MQKIKGVVKDYAWGGYTYLNSLLDLPATESKPRAEYWLGTHPSGPATYADNPSIKLSEALDRKSLPFLFKVLDVRDMLSIQVHPNVQQAQTGYSREEESNLPGDDPNRVYKDRNHKPELMVALSEFYLVQGFLSEDDLASRLLDIAEFEALLPILSSGGIKGLFSHWMTCPQEEVNQILKPLGKRIKPLYESGELSKSDIHFWAARAFLTFNRPGRCDRGIFVLYMMNLVILQEGEGIFQVPGVLHAYMEGQNVECMATSDNVVRGGLTQKHMDIEELIKVTNLAPTTPKIIDGEINAQGITTYPIPNTYDDFSLAKVNGTVDFTLISEDPGLIFCLQGSINISTQNRALDLNKGEAAYLDPQEPIRIQSNKEGIAFLSN